MLFGFVLPGFEFTDDLELMEPRRSISAGSSAESQEAMPKVRPGRSKEKEC